MTVNAPHKTWIETEWRRIREREPVKMGKKLFWSMSSFKYTCRINSHKHSLERLTVCSQRGQLLSHSWAADKMSWVEQETEILWLLLQKMDLRGLRSMQTLSKISLRNCGVLSCTTCWTLRRDFRYSRNRLKKPTKCSAVRIVPGTASESETEHENSVKTLFSGFICNGFLM